MERLQKQQGDVTFVPVAEMPKGAEVMRVGGRLILAEGEATGHAHAVAQTDVQMVEWDGKFYLESGEAITVRHEEHAPIVLEPGVWEVGRVREFDHFAEEARYVAD